MREPSDDTPVEVRIEIRAAEIAAKGGSRASDLRWLELDGWVMRSGRYISGCDRRKQTPGKFGELAGWLAHAIVTHSG